MGSEAERALTEGNKRVLRALESLRDDPFQGAVERRIMPDGAPASDMEHRAAEAAIADAGIDRGEIGLVLCYTLAPDYLLTNNACLLHARLGLRPDCQAIATEGACNAFLLQLALAEPIIASGRARYALLVQSCNAISTLPLDQAHSAWFGEGCTAVLLGPVREDRGILGASHRTDGRLHGSIVFGVPNRRWWEGGPVVSYAADPDAARLSFLNVPDNAMEVSAEALDRARCTWADIGFYAPHQGTRWLREVTQAHLGLDHARSIDTFPWAGSLSAANIPLALSLGVRDGLVRADDLVLMFSGGAGLTYSSVVLRWGRE
jgi:3-oxoacyl-[acyl-carrier-protein] synthase-3